MSYSLFYSIIPIPSTPIVEDYLTACLLGGILAGVGSGIVLTCGGSGLSPRDVTPEATAAVCDRNVPGIAEAMRYHSLQITPYAMLSRAVCMQRGRCIVINLPGSKKAAMENWEGIVKALPHAAKMMAGGGH